MKTNAIIVVEIIIIMFTGLIRMEMFKSFCFLSYSNQVIANMFINAAVSGNTINIIRKISIRSQTGHKCEYFTSHDQGGNKTLNALWKIPPKKITNGKANNIIEILEDFLTLRMLNFSFS